MFENSFEYHRKNSGENSGTATGTDEKRQRIIDSIKDVI